MVEEIRGPRSDVQTDRDLFKATLPFGVESAKTSWWVVGSTFLMLLASLFGAALAPAWPLRLLFSIFSALLMLRAFITYHDYMHNAILSQSRPARWLFRLFAVLALTPPRSWKNTHNHHHGHVGQVDGVFSASAATAESKVSKRQPTRQAPRHTSARNSVERSNCELMFLLLSWNVSLFVKSS